MWEPQIEYEESRRKINIIRDAFGHGSIKVKWNQPELSWLEGVFSRGDRLLSGALIEAWKSGARFDAWGEKFQMGIWKDAFTRSGISPEFYLHRKRSFDESLPWDHIDSAVSKEYLLKERQKAEKAIMTPDCRKDCLDCGVCDHDQIKRVISDRLPQSSESLHKANQKSEEEESRNYRLFFSKLDTARFLSHLELARSMIRAFNRADLAMTFSKGFHPMPRVSFLNALSVGMASRDEIADIEIYDVMPVSLLKEKLNRQLPEGIRINDIQDISNIKAARHILESSFEIRSCGLVFDRSRLDLFMASDSFVVIKETKKGECDIDIRPLVKTIDILPDGVVEMNLTHRQGPEINPLKIILEIFDIKGSDREKINILKTGQLLG
jgi:radical SAM-linked protein